MGQITSVLAANSGLSASSSNRAASAPGSFSAILQEVQQSLPSDLPPSAYVPKGGAYSVERCGSHIVDGVQLVPGAPGYREDLAAPWLQQIAASNAILSTIPDGAQPGSMAPSVMANEGVSVAKTDSQAASVPQDRVETAGVSADDARAVSSVDPLENKGPADTAIAQTSSSLSQVETLIDTLGTSGGT